MSGVNGARGRGDEAGVTLVELMMVIAIIAVLAVVAGWGMTKRDDDGAAKSLANKVYIALRQARNTAINLGAQVRVVINTRQITVQRAKELGSGTPTAWLTISVEEGGNAAQVYAATKSATVKASTPSAGGLPMTYTFGTDGSVDNAGTIYVTDIGEQYDYKVVLYSLTGYSRLMTRW